MQHVSTDRRDFLKATGVLAMTAAASGLGMRPARAQQVPYSSGTEAPRLKAPANACDCHMHIYDAKYPTAPSATLKPPDALVADYKLLQQRIGTTRNVIVTPSTYGTDNRITLDAMAQIGPTARGVAVVDTGVADAELKRMNDLGIRGIRFNLVQVGATTIEMIEPLSKRVNDLGWHIQIHMKGEQIAGIEDLLLRVPSPIVFDHLGRLGQPNALDNPGFKTVSKLIDKGKTWVKLAPTRTLRSARPATPTRCRLRAPTSKPPRNAWCGRATGLIRRRRTSRTMRCSSTCWRNGCPTRRHVRPSWSTTPPPCTDLRNPPDVR